MLDKSALQEYANWVGRGPDEVRRSVIAAGGWARIFPKRPFGLSEPFPQWANRVRNYFNATPRKLKRIKAFTLEWHKAKRTLRGGSEVYQTLALSDDHYIDENGLFWHEMVPVGSIYHTKGKAGWWKKAKHLARLQADTSVFKLISPDGTGGSREICIHNWQMPRGKSHIGDAGEWVNVSRRHVRAPEYRGSYNYSETVMRGLGEHDFRDVDPHKAMRKKRKNYVWPPMYQKPEDRSFPSRDIFGNRIAD